MDLNELFLPKGKKRRQAEEAAYRERIFNLGPGHRELALSRMRSLIREEKTDAERIYIYTCVKDLFTGKQKEDWREALREWYKETYLYPGDKLRAIALVLLEAKVDCLEDYPQAEAAEALAGEWEQK